MFKHIALMQTLITVAFSANNICKSYLDYPTKEVNENCYYDPMISATVPEMIIGYGYGFEEFQVITKDGYVLSLMHLSRNNSKSTKATVLLLHGAAGSSAYFVDKGPKVSLAFRLHDRNFDVWLGNFRGNLYSKSHKSYDTDDSEFWNYSMHEIGIYDIPAMLETVVAKTDGRKVFVVGHSMGGTSSVIYSSLRPEHAEKHVKAFVFMAISVFFTGIESTIKEITPYVRYFHIFQRFGDSLGIRGLALNEDEGMKIIAELALNVPMYRRMYMAVLDSLFGYDPEMFYEPTFPTFLSHNPSAVSLKILIHYAQLIQEKVKFQQFDYGSSENLKIYNQSKPPQYPIENINKFIYILVGERDTLVTIKSCKMFYDLLKEGMRKFEVVPGFNHLHFVYGKDLHVAYDPLIHFLENNLNL
ncbi:PREDICTED: gastric triacylglycerol lipase-like [Nicrophorus vespilloides]|uniref:Lipase n=1 Tax=Nicrophorus vespilloides TaxID=110193 RepID=A0ABM1M4D4_NICVS|nr:PREDICTED: gastric triacylglycerol lipase-like [Nicrophorus vespilloides]